MATLNAYEPNNIKKEIL